MPIVPTILHRSIRRTAVLAAGVACLGAASLAAVPATAGARARPTTIMVVHNKTWGSLLALGNGDTVYRFVPDSKNHSTCSGACAKVWPPVELAAGTKAPVGKGVKGLGTIRRAGGVEQVTYRGLPLYRFVGDKKPFQVTGNVKDRFGQWWTVNPAKPTAIPKALESGGAGSKSPTTQPTSSSGGAAF
jgi:predicted lipoprotein with Yx(FWY)xxD motif